MSSQLSFPTSLADDDLLSAVQRLVVRDNHNQAELLAHLAEIDARKLFLREACPSMFVYCTKILGFSESASYYRITGARVARQYPVVLECIREGELHLSGVSLLAPHLTPENHRELLASARHCSKREMRAEPLGRERFKIQFTASSETHDRLQEVRALIRHAVPSGDLDRIFNRALALLRDDLKRRRFAKTSRPRGSGGTSKGRHIPAAVRRAVATRDGEQCNFVASGRRCGSREFLEFHHLEPWARSRRHSADGITLFCRAHNQYAADQDFGQRFMESQRSRRS